MEGKSKYLGPYLGRPPKPGGGRTHDRLTFAKDYAVSVASFFNWPLDVRRGYHTIGLICVHKLTTCALHLGSLLPPSAHAPPKIPTSTPTSTQWTGECLTATDKFDYATALWRSVAKEAQYCKATNADMLADLSPLTSPEPSRPSSPSASDLFSLSPFSSPDYTPPSSPSPSATHLHEPPKLAELVPPEKANVPPVTLNPHLTPAERRRAKSKAAGHERTKKKKAQAREAVYAAYTVKSKLQNRHVVADNAIVCDELDFSAAENVASTGYVGLDDETRSKRVFKLEELVGENSRFKFKLFRWDGRTPTPIVDTKGRLIGILAGRPEDAEWPLLHIAACKLLERRRSKCYVAKGKKQHRRGAFVALACGVSHGGGQKIPGNLNNHAHNTAVLEELCKNRFFQRVAGFASSVMATWTPQLYAYYQQKLGELHAHDPDLQRSFENSVFSATSFNLGPRTTCFKHTDFGNLPFGLCAITAMGTFDYTTGGHLVMWECGLVIQFPPGSTILLPSAVVAHSNTAIGPSETRYSVAQYSAGGLFRWVDRGFQRSEDYFKSLTPAASQEVYAKDLERWALGLSLLPIFK